MASNPNTRRRRKGLRTWRVRQGSMLLAGSCTCPGSIFDHDPTCPANANNVASAYWRHRHMNRAAA